MPFEMKIIFVHGWGADTHYWDDLAKCLPVEKSARLDLGFTGRAQARPSGAEGAAIYITHSLGTMWALKHRAAQMKALISINGFPCFNSFTDRKTLSLMKRGLHKNAHLQMKQFYKRANMHAPEDLDILDIKRLEEGLDWLATWDARAILQSLRCPVIALAGSTDKIIPLTHAQEAWQGMDLRVCDQGGHNLPQTHAHWCARNIAGHINELTNKV